MSGRTSHDEVVEALEELCRALDENVASAKAMRKRADRIIRSRQKGLSYREIVEGEEGPVIVELISENLERLSSSGGRFRRAEAAALHADGMSMDAIATIFGVSRQRVSALLKPSRAAARPPQD